MTEDEMVGWHHRFNEHELWRWEMVKDREAWHTAIHGVTESRVWLPTEQQQNTFQYNIVDSPD